MSQHEVQQTPIPRLRRCECPNMRYNRHDSSPDRDSRFHEPPPNHFHDQFLLPVTEGGIRREAGSNRFMKV